MAIEKNSIITAADIGTKNKTLKTTAKSGHPKYTIGSDDQKWPYTLWFRNESTNNFKCHLDEDFQYQLRFYDNEAHDTLIFRWSGNSTAPSINTPGWGYEYYKEESGYSEHYVSIPKNTRAFIEIDYEDDPWVSGPNDWWFDAFQAQYPITVGENIRVWDTDYSAFLGEGDNPIDVSTAEAGWLGHE